MNRQQFEDLAKHKYGAPRPMSGAQLDAAYFEHVPQLPRGKIKALSPTISLNSGPKLQPMERDYSICAHCGGVGMRLVSVSSHGTKTYRRCDHTG